jgi:predicted dehydrogenase
VRKASLRKALAGKRIDRDMKSDDSGRLQRVGMVGGGRGSFIGMVHRIAVQLDGQATLLAGALSSNPENARDSAAAWNLARSYDSYIAMAQAEARLSDGIDFVIVATPNHLHYAVARAFLEAGIPVVCEKPLAYSVQQAQELAALVDHKQLLFAVTYNYTGYPAVRQAQELVRGGALGALRKVQVEYFQDWLMTPVEATGNRQASWRTDPALAGAAGCVGDIGSHAANLLEFVTGRRINALCADLSRFVPGRQLDDDANMLLRLDGGVRGTLACSQIACGEENNLSLRVYGERGGLEWRQQEPNTLIYKPAGKPWELLRTGQPYLGDAARSASRLPAGHPEGYLEAFAVIYRGFIADLRRIQRQDSPQRDYPTVQDGLYGMRFIAKAVESSQRGAQWVEL